MHYLPNTPHSPTQCSVARLVCYPLYMKLCRNRAGLGQRVDLKPTDFLQTALWMVGLSFFLVNHNPTVDKGSVLTNQN